MSSPLASLRNMIPVSFLLKYHLLKSILATLLNFRPSRKLLVIGITGTKGKSTTANFLWSILQATGKTTGLLGTANVRIGKREELNNWHMTMPSPFAIQHFLRNVKNEGGTAAILEFTSEGAKQSRHIGIDFDGAVFLNLSPEHLPSHGGSFEAYKKEKQKLFSRLASSFIKTIGGRPVPKIMVANKNDANAMEFLKFSAHKKYFFQLLSSENTDSPLQSGEHIPCVTATIVSQTEEKMVLDICEETHHHPVDIFLPGGKNAENALAAVTIARGYGVSWEAIETGLESLTCVPGRMERITEGQPFTVFVDYAHEEKSMEFVLKTGRKMLDGKKGKLMILLGAEGGGRDTAKRAKMGKLVGELSDTVMVSNVDPYEDNPTEICEDIASAAEKAGKIRGTDLFVMEDRRQGIATLFALAKEGDIVFITGKGSEQSIVIDGKKLPWDDRQVVREELRK
ncbi:MAG: UDP-N-acetylmuramyl-tripeptide synthetase [Candidatus Peregrinibacteria bacterium]